MKGVPEFSEGQIAVIGGMAIMKYLPGYRPTKVSLESDLQSPKPSNKTGRRLCRHHQKRPQNP